MEKTINDGGPAFPETRWSESHRQEIQWMGMSLRDYFAAKAMQTLLTKPLMITGPGLTINFAALSKDAYLMADAMIAERCNEVPRG